MVDDDDKLAEEIAQGLREALEGNVPEGTILDILYEDEMDPVR